VCCEANSKKVRTEQAGMLVLKQNIRRDGMLRAGRCETWTILAYEKRDERPQTPGRI